MTTFKQFFYRQEINESKAIMFPPEVQDKLYDIANKMIPALMHLSKKEQPKDYSFYILIDTIEFDDPYLNKKRTYDFYAVRTGSHEKNKNSGGWQDAFKERPQIVVTTNIVFPELEENQKWLDSLPEGTIEKILMNIVYNNKEIILEKIYNTLSHELGHAYDPTLSKGYRYKTGSPEEYIEKRKSAQEYKKKRGLLSTILDKTGISKLFGKITPEQEFQKYLKDSKKSKLPPYIHPSQHDGTQESINKTYDKYFYQESEFVAFLSGWCNYVINYARQSIKNDDPNTIVVKQIIVFKDLINYIREGTSSREKFNPLIQSEGFEHLIKRHMIRFKETKPSMYRKLLEKISNTALEAYNMISKHIEDNDISSQVNPEVSKWLHEKEVDPSIKVISALNRIGAKDIHKQEQYSASINQQTINFYTDKSNIHNKKYKTNEYQFMIRYQYPKNSVDEKMLKNLEYVIFIPDENNYQFVPIKKVKGITQLENYMTEISI